MELLEEAKKRIEQSRKREELLKRSSELYQLPTLYTTDDPDADLISRLVDRIEAIEKENDSLLTENNLLREAMEWRDLDSCPDKGVILLYSTNDKLDYLSGIAVVEVGMAMNGSRYFSLEASDCHTGCGELGTPLKWRPVPLPPIGDK